jgi:uncharacterized protein YdaU (DUF1376 family)
MPLYIADYLGDTQHLSTIEHGAYLLLIMHYWQQERLPNDEGRLARIARMTAKEWSNARATLVALFDGDWKHGRIDAEIALTDEKYEKRAGAGHKGGKASALARKKAKLEAEAKQKASNATAKLNQPHLQPQPVESKEETREVALSSAEPSDFDAFWSEWPNKVGKPAALKAFNAAVRRGVPLWDIQNGLRNYVRDKPPDRPWLNPATFLNQNRWEDQPAQVTNGKPQSAVVQAIRDLRRDIASFDGPAGEGDELCGGEGGIAPRLLSNG